MDDDVRVPIQVTRGCVVAGIQVDLCPGLLARLQADVLQRLASSGARGVILGLDGVELMDSEDCRALQKLCRMARLLGARTVLVGVRPEVASALVELELDLSGLTGVQDLDEAFMLLGDDGGRAR